MTLECNSGDGQTELEGREDHVVRVDSQTCRTKISKHQPQLRLLVLIATLLVSWLCAQAVVFGQQEKPDRTTAASDARTAVQSHAPNALRQFNTSLVALTNRVSR